MLVQDLIDTIRQMLAQTDNANTSWSDGVLVVYLNGAAKTIAMRIPWRTQSQIVGTGVSRYPLPANCMSIESVDGMGGDAYIAASMRDLQVTNVTTGLASPRAMGSIYAVQGRYVWFAPALSQTVILRYRGYPMAVTTTSDTLDAPETLRDCYINRVIADCLLDVDNPKATLYETKYENAIKIAGSLENATQMPMATEIRYPVFC